MNIILTSLDDALTEAWKQYCGELDNVEVQTRSILKVKCDAVVSPANSFGFMDGGIDQLYTEHFGPQVQDRLQTLIRDHHHGELLIGAAEIVETGNKKIPYLIAAPTMRVPMILSETVNPYLAARATLLLVTHYTFRSGPNAGTPVKEKVETVAFPGLGTGIGQVSPDTCARQVRAAIDEVCFGRDHFPETWAEAQERHQLLYGRQTRDLQLEDPVKVQQRLIERAERFKRRMKRRREHIQSRWKP